MTIMKTTAIQFVLGLYFFGSVEGSLDALKPNRAVLGSFESTQMGTLDHTKVVSEALEVSNFQRKLASITYENSCNSATGADRCCYDEDPGLSSWVVCGLLEATRDIVIPKGACVGTNGACDRMGDFTVGEYSCIGTEACQSPGSTGGSAIVASNSCKGPASCAAIGSNKGEATIGSNSCLEEGTYGFTCYGAGGNPDGKAIIGDDSCVGTQACSYVGYGGNEPDKKCSATIGKNSCRGDGACHRAGFLKNGHEGHSEVFIGDGSCNGQNSCSLLLNSKNNGQQGLPALTTFPPARIGKNSCNCESCCMCLIHGDIVPDDSCNSRGSGTNECCSGNGNYGRNENFDFDNVAGDPVTGPTAPTLPGSLASQATTTAVFAPAEFDVALSTPPGCEFTAGTDNIGTIACTFDTKGGADYTVDSALYKNDCSTAWAPTGVDLDTQNTGFNRALVSGTQYASTYAVTLPIANSAAAAGSTDIAFCLKTEVKDKDGVVYDWTGQKIKLAIDVNGGFSTASMSTVTFDGDAAAEQDVGTSSFGVSINRCDENGVEISNGGAALSLGDNFYLCVKGSQSQVVVSNIGEMTASKDSDTLSLVSATVPNSNTFVFGNGQNQVVIATRLPATFFASGGTVTFSGSANIVVGARRRLSRSMQASEESANFSMDIQVAGMDDTSSASAIKTTAAMFFAAVVAALIV